MKWRPEPRGQRQARDVIAERMAHLAEAIAHGDDPTDAIANVLWITGARGVRQRARACPLTAYFAAAMPAGVRVSTSRANILVEREDWKWHFYVPTPQALTDFIIAFDGGVYPALVEEGD